MIAVDTSTMIAYLQGSSGADVELLDKLLEEQSIFLPPVVVCELLSDPKGGKKLSGIISSFEMLDLSEGFWSRAGLLRSKVLSKSHKSRLGDVLVAQACIDNNAPLLTRDADFRHYVSFGLKLSL
jgi:predicted nucleic acid-binding protein